MNVAYGVVFSGPLDTAPTAATPIQVAQPGVASIDFHPGFSVGFAKSLDECNSVVASYSHYEGEDQDSISSNTFLIRSMVRQPSTWSSNAASGLAMQAASDYDIRYGPRRRGQPLDVAREPERYPLGEPVVGHAWHASLKQRLDTTFHVNRHSERIA